MSTLAGFFHKNHRPQVIAHAPAWTDLMFRDGRLLTRKRFTARRAGVLVSKLYLPLKLDAADLAAGRRGLVRVRLVREPYRGQPLDPTNYDERQLTPDGDGYARLSLGGAIGTPAEKGRRYRWQAQLLGDVRATTTGTHYAEWMLL